jgi:hypothetical protein
MLGSAYIPQAIAKKLTSNRHPCLSFLARFRPSLFDNANMDNNSDRRPNALIPPRLVLLIYRSGDVLLMSSRRIAASFLNRHVRVMSSFRAACKDGAVKVVGGKDFVSG